MFLDPAAHVVGIAATTAGMMHEVGLMVLAVNEPEAVDAAFRMALVDKIPMLEAERRLLRATHAQIGAYLLGLWGLPSPIVEAVAFVGEALASFVQGRVALARAAPADDDGVVAGLHLRLRPSRAAAGRKPRAARRC